MRTFVAENRNKIIWTLLAILYAGIVAWATVEQAGNLRTFADHESRIQALERQNAAMAADLKTLLMYAQENRAGVINIQNSLMRHMEQR